MVTDVHALDGKIPAAEAHYGVVVVGAGAAGIAAAVAAAKAGETVLLVDENPLPAALMGTDVPLFYGGRMTGAVQNPARMVEQLLAGNPGLEAAFEAGVEVRLGTMAWGLYRNGPAMRAMLAAQLGLADAERAWMVSYGRLVLATGARDLVLGFAGWDQPGVIGAQALHALLVRYDALASRRVLVLGSGTLACETALLAQARGLEIAGLIEVLDTAQAPAALLARVTAAGIPIHTAHVMAGTRSGIDGIEAALLHNAAGGETAIACDTICLALGVLPATELLEAAGATPGGDIALAGDCGGPAPDMAYVAAWSRALGRLAPPETIVCQCETVSRADLIGVQPPLYLDRPPAIAARSLATLADGGPAHPDQIKRLTRAGMGQCQGRRCRTQVACLLAEAASVPVEAVPMASFRAPVRPVPLQVLADWQESQAMADGWDVWFGIPTQWTPYADIGTDREAALVARGGNMHI
jgi:thioredoxin reductase